MKSIHALLAVAACALSACGGSQPPANDTAQQPPQAAQPAKPLPNSNVFSADVKALNKAKNVQNVVDDQKKKADQALKDSGG